MTISKTGSKRVTTNYITMHYPGRKPVYLQIFEFIGATVSEFQFLVICCNIIQEVKGLRNTFYCLGGRPVSMQNFRLIVHIVYQFLHGCGLHYNALSRLSVKQEVKGLS